MSRLLFFFLIVATQYSLFFGQVYFHPNGNSSQCPNDAPCLTIDEYTSSTEQEPLVLVYDFLPGTHSLNSSIIISNRLNISFQGRGEMKEGPHETVLESPVVVQCAEGVTIEFRTCDNIQIEKLTFKGCGKEFKSNADYFTSSAIFITYSVNVTMKYLSIQDSPGGAVAISVTNCQIIHSSFYLNNLNSTDNESSTVTVVFSSILTPRSIHAIFLMNHTNITNNRFFGLIVNPLQNNYNTNIHLNYLYIANNSVSNILVRSSTNLYDLFVTGLKTTGSLNGLILAHNTLTENEYSYSPSIHMTNCFVSYNQYVGINIAWFSSFPGSLHLNSSMLSHNLGLYGSALQVNTDPFANEKFHIMIHNVTFDRNTISEGFYETLGVSSSFIVTIGIFGSTNVVISNCTISNNEGSGLGIIDTYITFYGINIFHNNSAYNGGGIFMISSSFLILTHGSMLRFTDNHANNSGGAINVQQIVLRVVNEQVTNRCFYQLQNNDDTLKYFYFGNNTADVAGSVLYGGATSYCIQGIYRASEHQFTNISTFVNQTGLSIISSDPRKVCFCDDTATPNCNLKSFTVSATPGESVPFIVAVVGQHDNTTTGTVSVSIGSRTPSNHNISSAVCINLTQEVTVEASGPDKVTINVTLTDFETNFFQPPLTIDVNVNPCLPGTYLSQQSQVCVCDDNIKAVTTNCNGVTTTVTKEGTSWLGVYENCTAINDECPYDYCIHSSITFSLSDPDRQCALNRSGLLCGKCKEGLSLMLGSNKCGDCTNDYLALLIPFSLAGVALIVLLIVLNLTVTVGTINGLLFFANVVKIYQPLFFGLDAFPVLSQFISWINLDFGIEACFYAGMNTCTKTGLQFVFPLYLWFLIFLIIMLSRRSSKLSQLIGNNAVPVLCTLLLLSYTKILRTLISIFIFVNPVSTCRSIGAVWFNNAEPYLSGCHLVFFIFALIVLIVLLVPYTLFLLFFPLWELCRSKWSIFTSLYLKLKPFFDAYAGPHTDMFRIWPGLLLLARIVIMLSTVAALDPVSEVTLGVLVAQTAVLIITMSYVSVYKNKKIQSLDISYLVCLLIICYVIRGSLTQNGGNNSRLFHISRKIARVGIGATLSLSLISFLAIMVYHVYICVPWTKIKRNMRKHKTMQLEDIASEPLTKTIVTTTVIPNLREPLLESSAD